MRRGLVFWVVAIAALIWNGMGVMNLWMQMTPAMVAEMPPAYQSFVETRPVWALAGFAVSVIIGVLAALALMMGRRSAVWLFAVSAAGAVVATVPTLGMGDTGLIVGSALSAVLAIGWALYAARRRG